MESKSKPLRSGFTTGACAAAAAKAATMLLLGFLPPPQPSPRTGEGECQHPLPSRGEERGEGGCDVHVAIPFPDGARHTFMMHKVALDADTRSATASIIKDAGDDPDVTHGAEIVAKAMFCDADGIVIKGGIGVGRVTKPGLAIPIGEAAINPTPRKMIEQAVHEAMGQSSGFLNRVPPLPQGADERYPGIEITISVPNGEQLAKKTLNHRLGIVGGISILGTTGIVKPISTEAYTASITAAMDVAKAAGLSEIVISTGRTSEKAFMKRSSMPEVAFVMMGDYLEFALRDAQRHGFASVHLCGQWAKLVKTAMGTPQTHVRHGALEAREAAAFLTGLGIAIPHDRVFNTTREIFDLLDRADAGPAQSGSTQAFGVVCAAARRYARTIASGMAIQVHLVSYEGEIIATAE